MTVSEFFACGKRAPRAARAAHRPAGVPAKEPVVVAEVTRPVGAIITCTVTVPV